jgi:uncharacterized membrane protein YqhA
MENGHSGSLVGVIGAVNFFLMATVLIIFSFGISELFLSRIDITRRFRDLLHAA